MSIQIMTEVWSESKHKGSELLTLIAIADMANEHGEAYPSVAYIARKIRMTPRNTQKLLQKLEASGELVARENAGRGGTNLYRVVTSSTRKRLTPEEVKLIQVAKQGGEKISGVNRKTGANSGSGVKSFQGGEPQFVGGVNAGTGGGVNPSSGEGVNAGSPETSVESLFESSVEAEEEVDAQLEALLGSATAASPEKPEVQKPQNGQAQPAPTSGPEGKPASAGIQTNAGPKVPGAPEVDPDTTRQLNLLFGQDRLSDMLQDPAALVDRCDWCKIPLTRFQEILADGKREVLQSGNTKKIRTVMKFLLDAEVGSTMPLPSPSGKPAYRAADDDFQL